MKVFNMFITAVCVIFSIKQLFYFKNRMIGYLDTIKQKGRLKLQINVVTFKLTHKNCNFYSKPIHGCSARSDS